MEKTKKLQSNFEITAPFLLKVIVPKQPACSERVSYNRLPQTMFQQALNISIMESSQTFQSTYVSSLPISHNFKNAFFSSWGISGSRSPCCPPGPHVSSLQIRVTGNVTCLLMHRDIAS